MWKSTLLFFVRVEKSVAMKNIKTAKIIMIIAFSLSVVFFILLISMRNIDRQTENTTTLFAATVEKTVINTATDKPHAEIHTVEYGNWFYITQNIGSNINIDDLKTLEKGEKIYFRIENKKTKDINNVIFIDIVSLKTDDKNIFTIEDYNKYMHDAAVAPRIAGIVLSLSLFCVSFCCFIRIIRIKRLINNRADSNLKI